MDWNFTWQDPVALALVVAGFAFAVWLRRRLDRKGSGKGCAACLKHQAPRRPRRRAAHRER